MPGTVKPLSVSNVLEEFDYQSLYRNRRLAPTVIPTHLYLGQCQVEQCHLPTAMIKMRSSGANLSVSPNARKGAKEMRF